LDQAEPLVLFQGVIGEYKGVLFLLEAWKSIKQTGMGGRLLVAGTGNPQILAKIREKVASDGIADSVTLRLEFIPVAQLPLLYQAADVLVYPYKAGTTSGALLTGLNYGKAIVATRLAVFEQHLTDGKTALLVEYGATECLALAIGDLLREPDLRAQLASALSRQASARIGWEEIASKTRDCYDSVLAAIRPR
jgi:glycosyltransferase involved in cell wall biosynthesis